jgi:hypothetical protein
VPPFVSRISLLTLCVALAGCFGTATGSSTTSTASGDGVPVAEDHDREPSRASEHRETASRGDPRDDDTGVDDTASDRDVLRELAGEWHLANRDAEARIDRAVSEVTNQMNFLTRGIANGRIDEAVNPDERVSIEADGASHIVFAIGRGRPVRLEIGGPSVASTSADGRAQRVRAVVRGGRLSIHEQVDGGTRVLTFRRRGDTLWMTTRIQSDRLPDEIVYGLDYRLAGGGAVASR